MYDRKQCHLSCLIQQLLQKLVTHDLGYFIYDFTREIPLLWIHCYWPGHSSDCRNKSCIKFPSKSSCPLSACPCCTKYSIEEINTCSIFWCSFCNALHWVFTCESMPGCFKCSKCIIACLCDWGWACLWNCSRAFCQLWNPTLSNASSTWSNKGPFLKQYWEK